MQNRSSEGNSTIQRLFLLTATIIVGGFGWILLGKAESVTAAESTQQKVLARVDGVEITETEVYAEMSSQLQELERQKETLIAQAVEERIHHVLLAREAATRGISQEELLQLEVDGKTSALQDSEVAAFYHRHQKGSKPLKDVEIQVRRQLAYENLIHRLKTNTDVEILTEIFQPNPSPSSSPS